jgi:hypothetical protein
MDYMEHLRLGIYKSVTGRLFYLVFEENRKVGRQPWYLVMAGAQISAPELPSAPDIPEPPVLPIGAEIVMMQDHMLGANASRVPFLADTPFNLPTGTSAR